MATTQDIHAPTLGAQGEPCASCGAPLAGDQRYCLECGARRAQARVPFRAILAPGGAPPTPPPGLPASPADGPPARSGLSFLAGLLCLLLALGVGVLIGNSGDATTAATKPLPPQVITVGGAAAPPAATTPAATTTAPAAGASTTGSAAKPSKSGAAAKSTAGSKAASKKLQDLDSSSGSDYQKKSQKLPKEVGTSGKPPAKDNKPAGGGSDFEDIG